MTKFYGNSKVIMTPAAEELTNITVREDYSNQNKASLWKRFQRALTSCVVPHDTMAENNVLVEVTQVMQPVCSTLTLLDIAGTSVTSHGLQCLLRKLNKVKSLGEYTISDNFLRSLCVVSSLNMDQFSVTNLHARKIGDVGMYNMVHVFPYVEQFTCWEPAFDLADLVYFCQLKELYLLRVVYSEAIFQQLLKFFKTSQSYVLHAVRGLRQVNKGQQCKIRKLTLEFVLQDDFSSMVPLVEIPLEFDIGRLLTHFETLKFLSAEFKDTILPSPPVCYSSVINKANLRHLVYVQLGQVVQNSAIETMLRHCPQLNHLHCNTCPNFGDLELASCVNLSLECFYIYDAPCLTAHAFDILTDSFPRLKKFGNLTRWNIKCEEIQKIMRQIRETNLDLSILCGSHWFTSSCADSVDL